MKYIFISGGVISGIGKGIATASIALLLKAAPAYKVVPVKMDPYLNVDAGTMNPLAHTVRLLFSDDGRETDQDLGHYERFINESLNSNSISTQGSIYLSVIQKERNLEYDGDYVDIHNVTQEIIRRIQEAGRKNADIVLVEIGGTAGEYQNVLFLEANRLMKLKKHSDVIHVHISYLPIPTTLGEMKSKPVQMSVRGLNSVGIQPDIILARAEVPIDAPRRKRLAMNTGIEEEDVIAAPDVESIYQVPLDYEKQNITERILQKLDLKRKQTDLKEWKEFVEKSRLAKTPVKIAIVGKYFTSGNGVLTDSYVSVIEAIKHASYQFGLKPEITWMDAARVLSNPHVLSGYQGIIVPGGFGARDIEGKIEAIRYARENKIPYLGLCYGMQLAMIEMARNVLGLKGANSTEIDPKTKYPIVHIMPDQEKKVLERDYGGTMRLGAWECVLKPGSMIRRIYGGKAKISEGHRHRYEVNNAYREQLEKAGMKIVGTSPDGKLVEIMELENHPFFTGSQFHPELKSRPLAPAPMFMGFLEAASKLLEKPSHPVEYVASNQESQSV